MAAYHGHLKVLQWLHANGCEWDSVTCSAAAGSGHLDILKWAREQGCPWDDYTTLKAAKYLQWHVFEWAVSNGAPLNSEAVRLATVGGYYKTQRGARVKYWDKLE